MQLLYPKEEEIMYTIWSIGHPCVISEILKSNPSQKRNTVAKVLIILEKKGYLKVDSIVKTATRCGRAYAPIVFKDEYEKQKNLFATVEKSMTTQDGVLSFISTLIDANDIDEQFIKTIDNIIGEYKKTTEK